MQELTKQYWVSVAAGKRLIAKAVLELPQLKQALRENTVVITAGTTNGYIAEEVLDHLGQKEGFPSSVFTGELPCLLIMKRSWKQKAKPF